MFEPLRKQLADSHIDKFGLIDSKGIIILSDDINSEGGKYQNYDDLKDFETDSFEVHGKAFYKIRAGKNIYYVYMLKDNNYTGKLMNLLSLIIKNYINYYTEKYDKYHFIKDIMNNSISSGDIIKKSSAFKIHNDYERVAIVIRCRKKPDYSIADMISNIFPDKKDNYVIEMDNEDVVYIIYGDEDKAVTYARTIIDTAEEELYVPVFAGIGSKCENLADIRKSYENACLAIDSGMVFKEETSIYSYKSLGIGKLLYKLDAKTLENYLKGTIDLKEFSKLDDEIIKTLQKFFENNLNISETARQLYLHRNTLVYRIDKVHKTTGLDVRNFDDAVLFKVIYMIKCYIEKLKEE